MSSVLLLISYYPLDCLRYQLKSVKTINFPIFLKIVNYFRSYKIQLIGHFFVFYTYAKMRLLIISHILYQINCPTIYTALYFKLELLTFQLTCKNVNVHLKTNNSRLFKEKNV